MMEEDLDDAILIERGEKVKRPAKKSSHDKAALLSSGEDDDDDEEDEQYAGEIIHSVSCDEGDSVSGSDTEVTAFTGEQETYIGDSNNNIDQIGTTNSETEDEVKASRVKEGTLIKINDNDVVDPVPDENEEIPTDESAPPCLPTNDNISEIANKLKETNISGTAVLIRENQDYLENMGFRESSGSYGYNSTENGSYSSSSETRRIENNKRERRKKFHKKSSTTERENIRNTDIIDCNGVSEHGSNADKPVNGYIMENGLSRERTCSKSSVSHSDSDNKGKHIKPTISTASSQEDDKSTKNSKVLNKTRTRTRTRHKVYLDDPDVHQLINEHVILLKRFMDDVQSGKISKSVEAVHEEEIEALPNVGFTGTKNMQQPSFSIGPYGHHKSRGRDMISRIRSDSLPYDSDEDEDEMYDEREIYTDQKDKMSALGNKENSHMYEICPDCGERHPPDEMIDEAEICPDCGVQHNPYQHTPSANKPWNKYVDSCRKSLLPGKRYQQVSTEQDPHDEVEDPLPSIEGPHTVEELTDGARYNMKYLGSSQIISHHPINKETRMQQAQDAYNRMKGEDNEDEEAVTNVDMLISLERIKILNRETKFEDVMMDHALRTVCFICDMGNILVLMARRLTSDASTDFSVEKGKPITLGSIVGEREKKTSKNICHVFETEDAQKIAKAIGQAFNIAYRNFLQSNGISHEHVEEAEYCHVLESQKLVGVDLDRLTDESASKDVVLHKKAGEALGIMLLESGWGSMLPTVFVAHIANYSVAARCQQLMVGDHVLSCDGLSFVGMSLTECNNILKNARSSNHVKLSIVSCPPVVDVVISRPDVKYQLGFSVQNGTICSLLRGGIAERGGVRVGHRIIEINGDSVVAKSHQYIVDLLANTIGSIGMKTMPIAMYRLMVGDDQPQHI